MSGAGPWHEPKRIHACELPCVDTKANTNCHRRGKKCPGGQEWDEAGSGAIRMSNPHQEEYEAEVRTYVIWCEGKLEELRQAGLLAGEPVITMLGMTTYFKLVEAGFRPDREKLLWTLQSFERFQDADIELLVKMMMATD